ncbi:MAG: hypothetical protein WBC78_04610 [Candidatus Sulfotelmatobacter sp.]
MAASTTLPNHSSTRHSFSADAWENLLFVFLLGIYLVPIWWFPYFPSQDGPGHLYNAYLLSGWSNSSFPIDRSFFAFNPAPVPNWLGSVLLALLIKITTPLRAEKLALTLYVVFLPVAMRYGARSVRSDARYLYFLAFAFVYNWFFHLGMLNFCISLAWYLLFIGYWIRNRDHLHARQMFVLLAITVPFYFSNGLSYYMALGAVGVLSVAYGLREFDRATWKQWCINILKPQIGLLLAIPLTLSYLALHGRNYHPSGLVPETPMTWKDVIWSLSRLTALRASTAAADLQLSRALAILLLIGFLWSCYCRRKERRLLWTDSLLVVAAAEFVLYLIAPENAAGGSLLQDRMILFPLLTFALWFVVQPIGKISALILAAAALVLSTTLVGFDVKRYAQLTPALEEFYATSSHIEQQATILPLEFGRGEQRRDLHLKYDPFLHAAGLISIERSLVNLNDYEAESRNFPLVYKAALDPSDVIGEGHEYAHPPVAHIGQYYRATGRSVDYVLLWGVDEENSRAPAAQDIFQELAANYVLIYSAPHSPLQLYRRRQKADKVEAAIVPGPTAGPHHHQ